MISGQYAIGMTRRNYFPKSSRCQHATFLSLMSPRLGAVCNSPGTRQSHRRIVHYPLRPGAALPHLGRYTDPIVALDIVSGKSLIFCHSWT